MNMMISRILQTNRLRLFLLPDIAPLRRSFSSHHPPPTPPPPPRFTNTEASFDWSDSDDEGKKGDSKTSSSAVIDKSKLPPPYDPFNKKPVITDPKDPRDLQQIFHKMRSDGLTDHAVKMFDGLSKDGLTHEALELFAVIKDKGTMPDVVAHTAVIEAYANAGGKSKEAVRTYKQMLMAGVLPNAYTYSVLIRGLAKDGKAREAKDFVLEMMGKGMKPNPKTYTSVFEAYVKEKKEEEAREALAEMKKLGFVADEKAVREEIGRRGQVFRSLMNLLFAK